MEDHASDINQDVLFDFYSPYKLTFPFYWDVKPDKCHVKIVVHEEL